MILNKIQLSDIEEALNDDFPTLIEIFLSNSEKYIKNICTWDNTSQSSTVMIAAHTLKSSAANLGLEQLASQCSLIESACNNDQDISELIANIDHLYNESITALKKATETENV